MMRPLFDRVVVKRNAAASVTPGGILLPETGREKPVSGVVLSVGAKCTEVKAGDVVYFGKYSGAELAGEADHLVMKEEEIIGVEVTP